MHLTVAIRNGERGWLLKRRPCCPKPASCRCGPRCRRRRDRQLKAVVLAIRGTHSFKDMFTSLTGEGWNDSFAVASYCNDDPMGRRYRVALQGADSTPNAAGPGGSCLLAACLCAPLQPAPSPATLPPLARLALPPFNAPPDRRVTQPHSLARKRHASVSCLPARHHHRPPAPAWPPGPFLPPPTQAPPSRTT